MKQWQGFKNKDTCPLWLSLCPARKLPHRIFQLYVTLYPFLTLYYFASTKKKTTTTMYKIYKLKKKNLVPLPCICVKIGKEQ